MVKRFIHVFCLFLIMPNGFANTHNKLIGWHWYNEPVKQKIEKRRDDKIVKVFNQLSPLQQLKILKMATNNLKAKAVLSGKVSDITEYKKAQDYWVQKATRFTVGWEQMLLQHPALNYSLNFSHENAMASVMQRDKHARENQAISSLAQDNGLLFFYRGKNKGDRLFSKTVARYSKRHHLVVIPVSVDGQTSPVFKASRHQSGMKKATVLGIHYFPALVLVNPKSNRHKIVSYGFKSENEISDRLLKIADGWKAEF